MPGETRTTSHSSTSTGLVVERYPPAPAHHHVQLLLLVHVAVRESIHRARAPHPAAVVVEAANARQFSQLLIPADQSANQSSDYGEADKRD
jgi:hypothetical protein